MTKQNLTPEIWIAPTIEISKIEACLVDGRSLPFSRSLASKNKYTLREPFKNEHLQGAAKPCLF
jgi:hypothetical protein